MRHLLRSFPALVFPLVVAGQGSDAGSLTSYRQARTVLDAAIAAHGGDARFRALDDVTLAYQGKRHMEYQSFTLTRPWNVQPNEWELVLDLKNRRIRRQSVERYPKDFEFAGRQAITADGGWWVEPTRGNTGDAIARIGKEAFPQALAGWQREVPAFLLTRVRDRSATLRSLGAATEGNRRFDVITYAEPNGQQVTLYFDSSTKLLARVENLVDDGIVGDQVIATHLSEYRAVNGVQFATRRTETRNGQLVREGTLAVSVNTHPHDSLFAAPSGYAEAEPPGVEGEGVRKLADNVYLIQNLGNRVLFVAFSDHVLVFEAPLPQSSAFAVMDAVRKTVPGKPIRYVTFSHHHDDHGGGLRPYIASGVTIVTTPTNRRFVEQVASAKHTIVPDTLSRAPKAPVIETFSGKRVFTDGTMTVELHELGANSHVDEMLLAYLPAQRLIFQGDLLIAPNQGAMAPANTLTAEFLKKIEAMGWQVETIAGVHGRVVTLQDLRDAVSKRVVAR
jgi:glyoxylase-like metal-dependent hydrolase (beta-lactamase superfamily II)